MDANKMTAVEWLFEKLPTIDKYDPYYADIFQQAKAMEKEQIYSEEKVLDIFSEWFCYQIDEDVEIKLSFQQWFEQFKKK